MKSGANVNFFIKDKQWKLVKVTDSGESLRSIPRTPANVTEKKKTPTKQKRKSAEASPSGQMPFKKIPEYVNRLLEKKHSAFTDKDFAERALSNLARKLASQVSVLEEWNRAISEGECLV